MSFPLNALNDDRPVGKLPPALLEFNQTLRRNRVVPKVRTWVAAMPMAYPTHNYQAVANRIISETRTRIVQYHDAPLDALALSAVLNTVVYRDNSVIFEPLVARAKEAFASVL